jgi:hypothetical protein
MRRRPCVARVHAASAGGLLGCTSIIGTPMASVADFSAVLATAALACSAMTPRGCAQQSRISADSDQNLSFRYERIGI